MELDIAAYFSDDVSPFDCSHSIAEGGKTAGPDAWKAANAYAAKTALLETPEEFQAFRDHVKGLGAWDDDEIAAWSDTECNALLLQMISGDLREAGLNNDSTDDEWSTYEADENASHRVFKSDDRYYYYLGD